MIAGVADLLESAGPPLPLVGYSQGGRIALLVALRRPELVSALVLVSASAGIADPSERAARRRADEELARRIETLGVGRFLDGWLAGGITATTDLPPAVRRADRRLRETNSATGLAAALRGYGQGRQPWVGDRLSELPMPVTALAGGADPPAVRRARHMAASIPRGTAEIVPGCGHNLLLRAPGRVAAAIERTIRRAGGAQTSQS